MTSGSAAGAVKSVTTLALEAACSRISLALRENASCYLQEESIHGLLDDLPVNIFPIPNFEDRDFVPMIVD
jgi:hypothetical protein